MAEYGLLLALVALAVVASLSFITESTIFRHLQPSLKQLISNYKIFKRN